MKTIEAVVEPRADNRDADHRGRQGNDLPLLRPGFGRTGNLLGDTLMRAGVIEELNILFDNPVEMPLAEQDEEIEASAPQPAPEPLADGIRLRRSAGR